MRLRENKKLFFYKLFNEYFIQNLDLMINNSNIFNNYKFIHKIRINKVKDVLKKDENS